MAIHTPDHLPPDPRRALGARGERLAADHLQRLGFTILEHNYRTRFGELDLIAHGHDTLVFCEVKTRIARGDNRDPLESVHLRKQLQVRRIAGRWLAARGDHPRAAALRFDAIGVTIATDGSLLRLDHIEGAF